MKRFVLSFLLLLAASVSIHAMSYREAREYAYFLTDKMAYELNLTPEQYDRCYEVNLDYLMSVGGRHDLYGNYWSFRDSDLRYILFDWQYALYRTADYFFRPLSWRSSSFVFALYDRYRQRDFFYYGHPSTYAHYRGVDWRMRAVSASSPYSGMVFSGRKGGMRGSFTPSGSYGYNYYNGHRYDNRRNYKDYYAPVAPRTNPDYRFESHNYRAQPYQEFVPSRRNGSAGYRFEQTHPDPYRSQSSRTEVQRPDRNSMVGNSGSRGGVFQGSRSGSFDATAPSRGRRGSEVQSYRTTPSVPAMPQQRSSEGRSGNAQGGVRNQGGIQIISGRR